MKYLRLHPKGIMKFESYTASSAPLSTGANIEQIYNDGGPLSDKRVDKTIMEEQKEELEKEEEKKTKRVKNKKKYS